MGRPTCIGVEAQRFGEINTSIDTLKVSGARSAM